jgi:hypothetical protein
MLDLDAITTRAQFTWGVVPLDVLGATGDQVLRKDVPALVAEVARLRAENERLRKALAFAASVIKSGESWTATCEDVIGGALRHEK